MFRRLSPVAGIGLAESPTARRLDDENLARFKLGLVRMAQRLDSAVASLDDVAARRTRLAAGRASSGARCATI